MSTAPEADKAGGFAVRTGITAECETCSEPIREDQRALTNGRTTSHVDCVVVTYPTVDTRRKDRVGTRKSGKHARLRRSRRRAQGKAR